ncbi:hypothetical protein O5161_26870, partial [Escherichia coli]|nr:hypothetical protein [Escherichia coli]
RTAGNTHTNLHCEVFLSHQLICFLQAAGRKFLPLSGGLNTAHRYFKYRNTFFVDNQIQEKKYLLGFGTYIRYP